MNLGNVAAVGGTADWSSASSAVISQLYQYFLDQSTPLVFFLAVVLALIYALRVVTPKNNKKHYSPLLPWQFPFLFPDELQYEVLLRLPVRSLLRYRSVSKGMRELIDSSLFIKNYNIHRSIKLSERAAARSHLIDCPYSFLDNDIDECVVLLYQNKLRRFYSLKFDNNRVKAIELSCCDLVKEGGFSKGFGCNGIYGFLRLDPHHIVFWNPSNDTYRNVDCSSFPPLENIAIGYDNVNDDYKIIGFINKDASAMQVYSLRTDSWTKLCHREFPSGWVSDGPSGVTKAVGVRGGGIMHWMWTTAHDQLIVAFNLVTETFSSSLPLPSEARQLHLQPCHFTDFRGCLCVIFVQPGVLLTTDGPHSIWVMKKYGVESSWSRLYKFKIDTIHTIPNNYFPNSRGRLICYYKQLSWWDHQEGTFEKIEIPESLGAYPLVYLRNLIRLDQSLV